MKYLKLTFLFFTIISVVYAADIPRVINYQGKLTDSDGIAVNDTVTIIFRLYETETDGMVIWMEGHPNVPVLKGLFSVQLGKTMPLNLPFDKQYFLGIEVNGSIILPRLALNTSPYAVRAIYSDTAIFAQTAGASPAQILNQNDSTQSASFNISGSAAMGTLLVSDIQGQDYMTVDYSGSPLSINTLTPVSLFSTSYTASGPGSALIVTFTGTFDDRASKNGALVEIQMVRDAGTDEVILMSKKIIFSNYMVYNEKVVTLQKMDFPPTSGIHIYYIRAKMLREPLDAARFVNGNIGILEIKR